MSSAVDISSLGRSNEVEMLSGLDVSSKSSSTKRGEGLGGELLGGAGGLGREPRNKGKMVTISIHMQC